MRNSKFVLPLICIFLIAFLAVLVILPVNIYAVKEEPGLYFGIFGWWYCFCGMGNDCICVTPEDPTE